MLTYNFSSMTTLKWIASITFLATAHSGMLINMTHGLKSAGPRTGIFTFAIDASFAVWAVGIDSAFCSTIWWRSNEIIHTRAHWYLINCLAQRIRTTR